MDSRSTENGFDSAARTAVSDYLYTVLAPIVRMLIRFGWSAPDAEKVLRWVFVKVFYSTPDFWREDRPTALQGAIKIGIPRQQVAKLNEVPAPQNVLSNQRHNLACRVIEGWISDSAFQSNGVPAQLPLRHTSGPTFHRLTLKYASDVTAGAILADLREAGCVSVIDDTAILVNQTYGINLLNEDMLAVAGYSQQKLSESVDHNLQHRDLQSRLTQRIWWQSEIPKESANEALDYLRDRIVSWGRETDAELGQRYAGRNRSTTDYVIVGFGVYAFTDVASGAENIAERRVLV